MTNAPLFHTVPEPARILRVDPSTLYRAIRDDAFAVHGLGNGAWWYVGGHGELARCRVAYV